MPTIRNFALHAFDFPPAHGGAPYETESEGGAK